MCLLRNIAMRVRQTDRQTDGRTDGRRRTDGQTDDGKSDPYVSLCFAGDTKTFIRNIFFNYQINTTVCHMTSEVVQLFALRHNFGKM